MVKINRRMLILALATGGLIEVGCLFLDPSDNNRLILCRVDNVLYLMLYGKSY